jgi:hypothetical protein
LQPTAKVDLVRRLRSAASGRNRIAFDIGDISGRQLRVIVPIQDGHHAGNQPRSGGSI